MIHLYDPKKFATTCPILRAKLDALPPTRPALPAPKRVPDCRVYYGKKQ